MKICYVLSYRDPSYIRTRSLIAALEGIDGITLLKATNTIRNPFRYLQTLLTLIRMRMFDNPDAYLVGFRGHEIYWLVRLIVGRKPIIFDALMSPYAALHDERKFGAVGNCLSTLIKGMEKKILQNADYVLTDTQEHCTYYAHEFDVAIEKLQAIPVGADERCNLLTRGIDKPSSQFIVLFYGSFLPLHGIPVILKAAALLKDLPITFKFIGGSSRNIAEFKKLVVAQQLKNVIHQKWIPFDQLISTEIPSADLCLGGPFGGTPQAFRVVTGKTSQCLALGRTTIIGQIAEDFGFRDRENCLLVRQGDPEILANTIRWAWENHRALSAIGRNGQIHYQKMLSLETIRQSLRRNVLEFIYEKQ